MRAFSGSVALQDDYSSSAAPDLLTLADHLSHIGEGRQEAEQWARPAVYGATLGKGNPAPGKNLLCHTIPRGSVLCCGVMATAEKRIK